MAEDNQPIIIKKIKKGGHGGHHGGSWKVAYADFVTAMMAFFLLLWLLSTTSDDVKVGIASYFNYPSVVSPASIGGASTSMIDFGGAMNLSRGEGDFNADDADNPEVSPYGEEFEQEELEQLEEIKEQIEEAIEKTPELMEHKDQIIIDVVSEGLRIQIVDKKNRPMFDIGSAALKPYARRILQEMAPILDQVSNRLSISGHTDARGYQRTDGYSNWELSADRANASRRALIVAKLPAKKIGRVVGMASKVLFDPANPYHPMNRRISIIVLKKRAEDDMFKREGMDLSEIEVKPTRLPLPVPVSAKELDKEQLQEIFQRDDVSRSGTVIRYRSE